MENMRSINMPLFNEEAFCLVNFGRSVTYPGHTYGPSVRSYYLIHYVISGRGIFKTSQHTYKLHEGHGFLIEPNHQTVYSSDIDQPWTYVWVAINGRQAKNIINSMGLSQDSPIFYCTKEQGQKLENYVLEMLANNKFDLSDVYYRWGLLFQFFSVLAETQKNFMPKVDIDTYVLHMIDYIHNNTDQNINVQDVADYVNLHRSYATTIFSKQVGMSMHNYIQNCRLTKARHLLESSSLTIAEIAYSCGYAKSEPFVKAYRKMFGISPSEHRKNVLSKGRIVNGISGW